jgi:hypothetical protein
MLDVSDTEILRIAEQYVLYNLDINEGLYWLFDIKKGKCFNLNQSSFFILSCFDGKMSTSEVLQKLLSRYPNENPDKLVNDFKELVNNLKKQKVLSILYNNAGR